MEIGDYSFVCTCGNKLKFSVYDDEITIEACEECTNNAFTEGYNTRQDELENQ